MSLLEDRVVIVTGGGRGLGRAHCLELARHGATVVVNDVGSGLHGEQEAATPAEEVVSEIEAMGGLASTDGTSVTDFDGMALLVERTLKEHGRLDAVVNNAGIVRDHMLTSMTEEDVDLVVRVHLKGTFNLSRHARAHWWDRYDPANTSPVVAWLCSETSGWLSGAVLRIDGDTVQRLRPWDIDLTCTYHGPAGHTVDAEALDAGLRAAFAVMPSGLPSSSI